jgi:hypothetical protein
MILSEKARDILAQINDYLPEWAEFTVRECGTIYQATIFIESDYLDPFKITTESTCLDIALEQILKMLETYWVYSEDESDTLNEIIRELEDEKII